MDTKCSEEGFEWTSTVYQLQREMIGKDFW